MDRRGGRARWHGVSRGASRPGFTLIELLVAATLIGMVLAAGATLTLQVGRARENVERLAEHHAEADAAVRAITEALQQQYRRASDEEFIFEGIDEESEGRPADRLRFLAVSNRVIRPQQPESDVHEVEFYLAPQEGQALPALWRRTDPTRNEPPDEGGVVELVAQQVTSLDVEYFDGQEWLIDWPLFYGRSPTAVRLAVGVALRQGAEDGFTERLYRRLVHFPMWPQDAEAVGTGSGGGGSGGGSGGGGGGGGADSDAGSGSGSTGRGSGSRSGGGRSGGGGR